MKESWDEPSVEVTLSATTGMVLLTLKASDGDRSAVMTMTPDFARQVAKELNHAATLAGVSCELEEVCPGV